MAIDTAAPAASVSTTSTDRPTTVTAAFALWLVEIVASAIGGVLTAVVASSLPQVTSLQGQEREVATGFLITLGIAMVAFAVLRAFFAVKMRDGFAWARVTLTVLGLLSLIGIAGGGWIAWVAAGLTVAALIVMWLPSSNDYFAAKRVERG